MVKIVNCRVPHGEKERGMGSNQELAMEEPNGLFQKMNQFLLPLWG